MIVEAQEVILTLPQPRIPRSPGLHQSAIIRAIATDYGILKPEWCEEISLVDFRKVTDKVAILRMSLGLAWEDYYIPRMGEITDIPELQWVVDHPEEIQYEGVYMSMDGESLSLVFSQYDKKRSHYAIVHEVKVTYKSTNTVGMFDTAERLRKNWIWLAQLKTYCIAKRTRFAWIHVFFVCGDYKKPIQPQLWVFKFEFTEGELGENWEFMTNYVKDKREELGE